MKDLNLNEFMVKDEDLPKAKLDDMELKIPSDISFDLMVKCSGLAGKGANASADDVIKMKELLGDIFKTKNENSLVDKYMAKITSRPFAELVRFVFTYINGASEDEKQVEKKTD